MLYANILLWGVHLPFGAPALNVLITLAAGIAVKLQRRAVPLTLILFGLCFTGYGVITFVAGPCTDGSIKMLFSVVVMLLLILSMYWLATGINDDRPLITCNEASWLLGIIIGAAVVEYLVRLVGGTPIDEVRVGGLFLEPSHLALSSTPLLCYLFVCGKPLHKYMSLSGALLLLIIGFSSTLVLLLLALLGLPYVGRVARQPKQGSAIAVIGSLFVASALFLMSSASQDTVLRVTDILDLRAESNLSSLVYANGWMLLDHYVNSTGGFGLGFNAMGCEPRAITMVSEWLELLDLGDQNYNDGSFLLSKIGSEFGIVGILGFLAMTAISLKQLLALLKSRSDGTTVLCVGWLAIVFLGGVIRSGGGYFTGPIMLGIFAFFVLRRKNRAVKIPLPLPVVASAAPPSTLVPLTKD